MRKAYRHFIAASAALGLIQLGSPLAYLTIGSNWYGCYTQQFFQKIKWLFYLPGIDELLSYFYTKSGILAELASATMEELVYRGPLLLIVCLPLLKNRPLLFRILLTITLVFSIIHFGLGHACPPHPLWIAVILTASVLLTKSIIPAIAAHTLWNISVSPYLFMF